MHPCIGWKAACGSRSLFFHCMGPWGIELGRSGLAASALTHCAISPAHTSALLTSHTWDFHYRATQDAGLAPASGNS